MKHITETEAATIIATELMPRNKATDDLTNLHQYLREKYKDVNPVDYSIATATGALMSYNGYYTLEHAQGAFFTIDTNLLVKKGAKNPIPDVSLILSLDGKTSQIFSFSSKTGSFNENLLTMNTKEVSISLTFTRVNKAGVTATLKGSITPSGRPAIEVAGTTYNNIIPTAMYQGTYYENLLDVVEDPMLQIGPGHVLKYKAPGLFKTLKKVTSYVYNMNMYFFSFMHGKNLVKLIMGTSAQGGLVCNNLIVPPGPNAVVQSRSLTTVKKCTKHPAQTLNVKSKELAEYSGFYLISSTGTEQLASGAFISIEGIYNVSSEAAKKEYTVKVGISLDGSTTNVYTIDSNAVFEKETLTIPADITGQGAIKISFNRVYKKTPLSGGKFGSLVSIKGQINEITFTGVNPLNPVPLSAFKGVTMTTENTHETLVINSDTKITYNGNTYDEILYVPVMYILAFDTIPGHVVGLSLGTDGGKGTACIVTNSSSKPMFSSVFGIPNGKSGQPKFPLTR